MTMKQKHVQTWDVPATYKYRGERYTLSSTWSTKSAAQTHAKELRAMGRHATYKEIAPKKGARVYTIPIHATYSRA